MSNSSMLLKIRALDFGAWRESWHVRWALPFRDQIKKWKSALNFYFINIQVSFNKSFKWHKILLLNPPLKCHKRYLFFNCQLAIPFIFSMACTIIGAVNNLYFVLRKADLIHLKIVSHNFYLILHHAWCKKVAKDC